MEFNLEEKSSSEVRKRNTILQRAGLTQLVAQQSSFQTTIALIDGVIDCHHPSLLNSKIEQFNPNLVIKDKSEHATFIASMLVGKDPLSLGLTPNSKLVSIPIIDSAFQEGSLSVEIVVQRVVQAIMYALSKEAEVIQLSLEIVPYFNKVFRELQTSIALAASRGVRTVLSAGNRPMLGSSNVLSTKGIVPVAMADELGLPHPANPLSLSIGTNGLLAPGIKIPGATLNQTYTTLSGSSFAASFVTALYTLLRGQFHAMDRSEVWLSLLRWKVRKRNSLIPPHIDGEASLNECKLMQRRMCYV